MFLRIATTTNGTIQTATNSHSGQCWIGCMGLSGTAWDRSRVLILCAGIAKSAIVGEMPSPRRRKVLPRRGTGSPSPGQRPGEQRTRCDGFGPTGQSFRDVPARRTIGPLGRRGCTPLPCHQGVALAWVNTGPSAQTDCGPSHASRACWKSAAHRQGHVFQA